jgi:hypothetical protein
LPSFRVVALALMFLVSGQSAELPSFRDYRVSNIYRGRVKAPDFGDLSHYSGTDVRCFGEEPNSYTAKPANFSGHFVIDTCSCGSGCHYLFIWDALSGKVYREFPFGSINIGPYYGLGSIGPPIRYKGEDFRVDSSLLIVESCIEGKCDCAKRYYTWDGQRFNLVLKKPARMPRDCSK